MVQTDQDIRQAVYAAQQDTEAADALIRQYLPFIRAETVRFTHEAIEHGHEDALSIAMFAFYESILRYQASRGAFLPFAARNIRNRLIDQARAERRHRGLLSLQTPVGEDAEGELGDTLSGGERQRIGLARALLHEAPFLLLDEPTSNLDSLNEGIILRALREEQDDRTVILVSHRRSTLSVAHRTYTVDCGRLC